jgi:hypothetical protein
MPRGVGILAPGAVRGACDQCGTGIAIAPASFRVSAHRICLDCAARRVQCQPGTVAVAVPGDEELLRAAGAADVSAATIIETLRASIQLGLL